MKKCTKCNIDKDLIDYHKQSSKKSGLASQCKKCDNFRNRIYHLANLAKSNTKSKIYRESLKESIVYRVSIEGEGSYIGSTTCGLQARLGHHKGYLCRGEHKNHKLQAIYNKLGWDVFKFKAIERLESDVDLRVREQYYIDNNEESLNIATASTKLN